MALTPSSIGADNPNLLNAIYKPFRTALLSGAGSGSTELGAASSGAGTDGLGAPRSDCWGASEGCSASGEIICGSLAEDVPSAEGIGSPGSIVAAAAASAAD